MHYTRDNHKVDRFDELQRQATHDVAAVSHDAPGEGFFASHAAHVLAALRYAFGGDEGLADHLAHDAEAVVRQALQLLNDGNRDQLITSWMICLDNVLKLPTSTRNNVFTLVVSACRAA